jgi:hypothetical protein
MEKLSLPILPLKNRSTVFKIDIYNKKKDMIKKTFKFKNSWGKGLQWDKLHLYFRVGPLVLLELNTDWSNKMFTLTILNFKITNR